MVDETKDETQLQEKKPILCLDFDGVLHSYTSGWKGADEIPDRAVPGAMKFIVDAMEHFEVHIFSSRSNQDGGIEAMREWVSKQLKYHSFDPELVKYINFPTEKPPAQVTIDDRAYLFEGIWPDLEHLKNFKPWNKRDENYEERKKRNFEFLLSDYLEQSKRREEEMHDEAMKCLEDIKQI